MYNTIDSIREAGFMGFCSIRQLWVDHSTIPNIPGIYVIIEPTEDAPVFLTKGSGGFFKGEDPNVSTTFLADRWLEQCKILNVGKAGGAGLAATLSSRLKQYLDFGRGKAVGHRGGRLIWQLKHHPELLVAWKTMPGGDPRAAERQLIKDIRAYYGGRRPFANLVG